MKCGARVALGVAGGYFLGRTKKMKMGLMLAGMAAGKQAGGPGALLGQGKNLLNASPELLRLTDAVKGRLLDAGKGAALAVATRQVEALTDRVAGRVESSLGNLAERGRGATNSSGLARGDADGADEDEQSAEDHHSEPRDAAALDEDRAEEPRESASDEGSSTGSAPVRRARRREGRDEGRDEGRGEGRGEGGAEGGGEGGGRARKTGVRTAERRTTAAASGARRTTGKAAGRPARAGRSSNHG